MTMQTTREVPGKNTVFEVLQSDDHIHRRYSINVPYQVTYEFISGSGDGDYMNSLTLSESGQYLWRESTSEHNEEFRSIAPHSHDYYEWMIVLEGSVSQYIEGNLYRYEAGSACLVNRNLRHKEQFHESARLLFIGLSEDYLRQLISTVQSSSFSEDRQFLSSPLLQFLQEDLQNAEQNVYLDFIPTIQSTIQAESRDAGRYMLLHDLSQQLINCLLHPAFGASLLTRGLISSLLGFLANTENYHCSKVELTRDRDFLLFLHAEHLLSESAGRMTRSDLASALSYSGDYIARVIRKYSGMPLQDYRLQFSLRAAAKALLQTDSSVEEIARELGFSNRTYFYRIFQAKYGITPRQYRLRRDKRDGA